MAIKVTKSSSKIPQKIKTIIGTIEKQVSVDKNQTLIFALYGVDFDTDRISQILADELDCGVFLYGFEGVKIPKNAKVITYNWKYYLNGLYRSIFK